VSQNRYSSPDSSIHTALNSCQYDKPYSQGPPSFPITCSAQLSCCFSALQATGSWVGGPGSEARWDEIMCIGHPIVEMVDETLQIEADLGLILIIPTPSNPSISQHCNKCWVYKAWEWIYKAWEWIYKAWEWVYKAWEWVYKAWEWVYKTESFTVLNWPRNAINDQEVM